MAKYVRNGAPSPNAMQPAAGTARSQREPKGSTSNGGARPAQDTYDGEDFGKRIASKARELFDDEVSQRAGKGASELGLLADALRGAGSRLEGTFSAPYFDGAADQVERLAQLIKNANSREMIEAAQRLARQRPLLFLSAVVALGIGAGRFLRSSAAPALPSNTLAQTQSSGKQRSTRNRNNQDSQTRGTSHE